MPSQASPFKRDRHFLVFGYHDGRFVDSRIEGQDAFTNFKFWIWLVSLGVWILSWGWHGLHTKIRTTCETWMKANASLPITHHISERMDLTASCICGVTALSWNQSES